MLYGVGINDADYKVRIREELPSVNGKRKQKLIWICPYYVTWREMMKRAYSKAVEKIRPNYAEVTVCEEWLRFSNFKAWMEQQDWSSKQLDKDLLVSGNKVYGPDTCVFLTPALNSFLSVKNVKQNDLPVGVHLYKNGRYVSQCCSGNKEDRFLGYFDTPEEAHDAWKKQKALRAKQLIDDEIDSRVVEAVTLRFNLGEHCD